MYVLGNGTPIVPLRLLGWKGLPRQTGDASVIPYPSTSSPPETDSHSSTTDWGRFIAPEMQYFAVFSEIPRSFARIAVRS